MLGVQEDVPSRHIKTHLRPMHQMDVPRFQFHMAQLAAMYEQLHGTEDACDYCGQSFETMMSEKGCAILTYEHLTQCQLLLQMAILLSLPTWERSYGPTIEWPPQEVIMEQHRTREQRRWHFQAPLSDPMTESIFILIQCGKHFLDDEWLLPLMRHTCLNVPNILFQSIQISSAFDDRAQLSPILDGEMPYHVSSNSNHCLVLILWLKLPCYRSGQTLHCPFQPFCSFVQQLGSWTIWANPTWIRRQQFGNTCWRCRICKNLPSRPKNLSIEPQRD